MITTEPLLAVDIREAARRLSLSPRAIAALIASRELPSRKIGRRRIIPVTALEAFVKSERPSEDRETEHKGTRNPAKTPEERCSREQETFLHGQN
jgi:excisionase family DNA binding protein